MGNRDHRKNLVKVILANFISIHNKYFLYGPRDITQLIAAHSTAN